MSGKKGFSLIEMIIAMSIMALFGAIMMPNFSKIKEKAKEESYKTSIQSLQVALDSYHLIHNSYPKDLDNLSKVSEKLLKENYIRKLPQNPYTKKEISSSDSSGKTTYAATDDTYTITVYGKSNSAIIFTLSN